MTRRPRLIAAIVAALTLIGFGGLIATNDLATAVAPSNACDTAYPTTSSNGAKIDNLKRYTDCRFDRLEVKADEHASGVPTKTVTVTASPSASPSASASSTAPTATGTPPAGAVCTEDREVWSSTDHGALYSEAGYIVHNNQWNAANYDVDQTVEACSYRSWNAIVKADNSNGDGAVKTYPNVHKDYHNWGTGAEPALSSFPILKSTFAANAADDHIYNIGYDIWLNGVPGNREVMIWTDNQGQRPAGSVIATGVSLSGKSWNLWATSDNRILTFVATTDMTSGSVDLRVMLDHLLDQGRIPANSTLGQICYGVEVVSTGGAPMEFNFTDFSITDK